MPKQSPTPLTRAENNGKNPLCDPDIQIKHESDIAYNLAFLVFMCVLLALIILAALILV